VADGERELSLGFICSSQKWNKREDQALGDHQTCGHDIHRATSEDQHMGSPKCLLSYLGQLLLEEELEELGRRSRVGGKSLDLNRCLGIVK
jgi:hypothetical protein